MSTINTSTGVSTSGQSTSTVMNGGVDDAKPSEKKDGNTLDQSDFLALLTAQLKAQDPLDPMSNLDQATQMAQFSELTGINQMGSTLSTISTQLDQLIAAQTAAQSGTAANASAA